MINCEKTGIMCKKYTHSYYTMHLTFSVSYTSYTSSAYCIEIPIVCCTSCKNTIDNLRMFKQ